MIGAWDWAAHARNLIVNSYGQPDSKPSQIELRRAISAAYYALFHQLTSAGSAAFIAGGESLRFQATRAFSHAAMRKVCDAYVRSPSAPFSAKLAHLNRRPPNSQLITVATAFGRLQEGRHTVDYDLLAVIEFEDAAQLVKLSETALADFEIVKSLPDTIVFLTALLLADRWTGRG